MWLPAASVHSGSFTCSRSREQGHRQCGREVAVEIVLPCFSKFGLDPLANGVVISMKDTQEGTGSWRSGHLWESGTALCDGWIQESCRGCCDWEAEGTWSFMFLGFPMRKP